jgi:serine protease Do
MSRPVLFVLLMSVLAPLAAEAADPAAPRPWLGVYLDSGRAPAGEESEPSPPVVIRRVVADGPAASAGLRARDEVRMVDGVPVTSVDDFVARLGRVAPGSWVTLDVRRGGRDLQLRARLDERPERVSGLELQEGWIGVEAIDLPPALRAHFGAPEDAGVMVSAVAPASPAESAGLVLGDVVYAVDGEPVTSARDLSRRVAGGGLGNVLELTLMRSGGEIVVEAEVLPAPARDEANE